MVFLNELHQKIPVTISLLLKQLGLPRGTEIHLRIGKSSKPIYPRIFVSRETVAGLLPKYVAELLEFSRSSFKRHGGMARTRQKEQFSRACVKHL